MKILFRLLLVAAVLLAGIIVWDRKNTPPPPAPAQAPASAAPAPAPPPGSPVSIPAGAANTLSRRPMIEQAARSTRVTVTSYKESGSTVEVALTWKGDVATLGGDFLEACMRVGMRDFDELSKSRGVDRDHRQMWTASYRLKF